MFLLIAWVGILDWEGGFESTPGDAQIWYCELEQSLAGWTIFLLPVYESLNDNIIYVRYLNTKLSELRTFQHTKVKP